MEGGRNSHVGLVNMLIACPTTIDFDVYQPRNPKASAYYRCVEDHFERLEAVWDERYQGRFGFWRPYVTDVIRRYLDCGDLHFGFARVKCEDCGHEYLLAFGLKRSANPASAGQASPLLSIMPSETGGGIRRMVMHRSAKICAAPAVGVQHSKTVANLFYDGPQTIG